MQNVTCILALAAFICSILAAMGKCPEWVATLLVSVCILLGCYGK